MHSGSSSSNQPAFSSGAGRWFRLAVLLLPAFLLLAGSVRASGPAQTMLWLGGLFQVLIVSMLLMTRRIWQPSLGPSTTIVYLIAIAWLWMGDGVGADAFSHFTQFALLVVPLILFALQTLTDSGALTSRRARVLAQRLMHRKDWPADLADCRTLPEVKALREAIVYDASPALALLPHPRPQVRIAALAAMEFRKSWRGGQAELVLGFARQAKEPLVRAAAVSALANLEDRPLVEQLAEFLRDPAPEVRKAATEALLWDTEHRWSWIRHGLRAALGDPALSADGPLRFDGIILKPEAVNDLTAWAAEKGAIGVRAALTLAAHYGRVLTEQPGPELVHNLKVQLSSKQSAPALRIELAQMLKNTGDLDRKILDEMIDSVNPGPLRLIAADVILGMDKDLPPQPRALVALRDISRLPNREMALGAADVVQRRLGVDMGLALGQPLPPLHSKQAADVTRRLMAWAAQQDAIAARNPEAETVADDPGSGEHAQPNQGSGFFDIGSGMR